MTENQPPTFQLFRVTCHYWEIYRVSDEKREGKPSVLDQNDLGGEPFGALALLMDRLDY